MSSLRAMRGPAVAIPRHPSADLARKTREVFQDAKATGAYALNCDFPRTLVELGQGRSMSYSSNKWKGSEDDFEDFKHVAEGHQTVYATESFARSIQGVQPPRGGWPKHKLVLEMPTTLAELAPCIFTEIRMLESARPKRLADHAMQIDLPGAIYYSGHALPRGHKWGESRKHILFITAIRPGQGVLFLVFGNKLTVTEDGMCGLRSKVVRFVDALEQHRGPHGQGRGEDPLRLEGV